MKVTNIYFKGLNSQENSLCTLKYFPKFGEKRLCQFLAEILNEGRILPNTYHPQLPKRLCVSAPDKEFDGAYRPEGILFTTEQKPDYVCPVDLMRLMNTNTTSSSEINAELLPESDSMMFESLNEMLRLFNKPGKAKEFVNKIRRKNGLDSISEVERYNECGFYSPIQIQPVGLVGTSNEIYRLADKHNLMVYKDMKHFVQPTFLQNIDNLIRRRMIRDRYNPPCSIN